MRSKVSLSLTSHINGETTTYIQGKLTYKEVYKGQRMAQAILGWYKISPVEHEEFRISPSLPQLLCPELSFTPWDQLLMTLSLYCTRKITKFLKGFPMIPGTMFQI